MAAIPVDLRPCASPRPCVSCGGETIKVIYLGLPGRICADQSCATLDGIAAYAPPVTTETDEGAMFAFKPYAGPYLLALFRWLTRWD